MNEQQIKGLTQCVQEIKGLIEKGKSKGLKLKKTNLSVGTVFYYNYAFIHKKSEQAILLIPIRFIFVKKALFLAGTQGYLKKSYDFKSTTKIVEKQRFYDYCSTKYYYK